MWITMTCGCGKTLRAREEHAGAKVTCPACGEVLRIPESDAVPAAGSRSAEVVDDEPPPRTSVKAILALVFACLSFCLPVVATIPAILLAVLAMIEAGRSGGRIRGKSLAGNALVVTLLGTVCGLLLSYGVYQFVLWSAKEAGEKAAEAGQVAKVRRIAEALQNYEAANGEFPPAVIRDPQGKPLYSWRVAILPYLEEQTLYDEFKKDEPWDSPANKPLLDRMPDVFRGSGESSGSGTRCKVIASAVRHAPMSMFPDRGGCTLKEITDGPANTLMVVELGDPVEWTRPTDIPFEPNDGQPVPFEARGLGLGRPPFKFLAATADGTVHRLPNDMDPQVLRAMITCNGGEGPVSWGRYDR